MYTSNQHKRRRFSVNLIGIGCSLVLISLLVILPDTWHRNNVSYIFRGAVDRADYYITRETSSRVKGGTTTYNKSNLDIVLLGVTKKFIINQNIGSAGNYAPFEKLRNNILRSDSLYIGVDAADKIRFSPEVLEIKNSKGETFYILPDKRAESLRIFLITIGIGILLIGAGSIYFLPVTIKRKIGF